MTRNLGAASSWTMIGKRSNNWGRQMNEHMVKLAALTQGAAKSRTTAIPSAGSASEGDIYIDPATDRVYIFVPAWNDGDTAYPDDWYFVTPTPGLVMFVDDENKWYCFTQLGEWQMLWDPTLTHRSVQREFSFYNPYMVRKKAILFSYVATQETTIEEDAPGSGAFCEVAPTDVVVLNLLHNGTSVGSITFAAGETEGVVSFPAEVTITPTIEETMYTQARVFQIRSPNDTFGMEGLNVTIKCKIRSID